MNPALPVEVLKRFPIAELASPDAESLRGLAAKVEALAGGADDSSFTAGVAQTLRWLADGETSSEALSIVISATEAP